MPSWGSTGAFPKRGRLPGVAQPFRSLSCAPPCPPTCARLALPSCHRGLQPTTRSPPPPRPAVPRQREQGQTPLTGGWRAGESSGPSSKDTDRCLRCKMQPGILSLSLPKKASCLCSWPRQRAPPTPAPSPQHCWLPLTPHHHSFIRRRTSPAQQQKTSVKRDVEKAGPAQL